MGSALHNSVSDAKQDIAGHDRLYAELAGSHCQPCRAADGAMFC